MVLSHMISERKKTGVQIWQALIPFGTEGYDGYSYFEWVYDPRNKSSEIDQINAFSADYTTFLNFIGSPQYSYVNANARVWLMGQFEILLQDPTVKDTMRAALIKLINQDLQKVVDTQYTLVYSDIEPKMTIVDPNNLFEGQPSTVCEVGILTTLP
jgi:hypothetical protein